ncbi:TIGR04255 family protein [Mucilaginibacter boryungensis]|uniref:TIGR04255 family protein n=1 Tax=Mucilaginibacter boryungensis TaxID=768480 RepID=A0ABR9XLW6_9SPHI|nr:TIGR04255 family protein [Mucilaginibacter boryungensis]MBE9668216.1 TIGR04255 family protein [Mucilaginibacter boryungensis]
MAKNKVEYPHLPKSPVSTAVLEVRYVMPEKLDIANFTTINPSFSEGYPTQQTTKSRDFKIEELKTGKPHAVFSEEKVQEHIYISLDKKQNFKVTKENFNYNWNGSYPGWEVFIAEVRRVWDIYFEKILFDKIAITGVSIRFINKIVVDFPISTPADVFNVSINIAEGVKMPEVENYLVRYTISYDNQSKAIVTQALESNDSKIFPFIFDIDVILNQNIALDGIWENFDILRSLKNEIFFSSVKDSVLEMYK